MVFYNLEYGLYYQNKHTQIHIKYVLKSLIFCLSAASVLTALELKNNDMKMKMYQCMKHFIFIS